MADKAKSKSLEIEPIRYQGSVADFRAWMDGFLARAGVGLIPPSIPWKEIYKRAFEEQKKGDAIDFTRYYSRLIVRYSEVDQSSAREVWYVTKYDPINDDQSKPPRRWATILAIETLGSTTVEFLDGIYFRFRESNGRVIDYARTEFIGDEFSSYAKFIKVDSQKNFSNAEKVSTESQGNPQMDTKRRLRVFLCHASQDKPVVRELYQRLLAEDWIDPWLDEENLLPGQDFDLEINKATRDADTIITCLSKVSVTKEGYVNKEIRRALDIAEEKPEGTIYVIPLRLDDCTPSFVQLKKLQRVDFFPESRKALVYDRLIAGLKKRAEGLGIFSQGFESKSINRDQEILRQENISEINKVQSYPKDLDIEVQGGLTLSGHPFYIFAGIEFVKVPRGKFLIGSDIRDKYTQSDERPLREFLIDYDYYITRYPITNTQYAIFADAMRYQYKRYFDVPKNQESHPVANVSWLNAQGICLPSNYRRA